jgi:hypothetical protein
VVPKQVATLSIVNPPATMKAGAEVEVTVKVVRTNDYTGDFTVRLLLPPDVKGIEADDVTLPAGQDEVKIILRTEDDAAPGPRNNLTVQAMCELQGMTLTHEAKINVNVTK